MKLTKKEIIDKVASKYNLNNRAATADGSCYIEDADGNHCAVGMFITPHAQRLFSEKSGPSLIEIKEYDLDQWLIEEATGHANTFWKDIQRLHDRSK